MCEAMDVDNDSTQARQVASQMEGNDECEWSFSRTDHNSEFVGRTLISFKRTGAAIAAATMENQEVKRTIIMMKE